MNMSESLKVDCMKKTKLQMIPSWACTSVNNLYDFFLKVRAVKNKQTNKQENQIHTKTDLVVSWQPINQDNFKLEINIKLSKNRLKNCILFENTNKEKYYLHFAYI